MLGMRLLRFVIFWGLVLIGGVARVDGVIDEPFRPRQVLIKPLAGQVLHTRLDDLVVKNQHRVLRRFERFGGWQLIELQAEESVRDQVRNYQASGLVEFAEPNFKVRAAGVPNDPAFNNGSQWGLTNIGAPAAWDLLHDAPQVVVAVLDSGLRVTHVDLTNNLWRNPAEVAGDKLDNDKNNIVDDVHGFASYYDLAGTHKISGDVTDGYGHGTHLSGVIGAMGNNGIGGSGVAWRVQIMPLKFFNDTGDGSFDDAVACIDYAIKHGAQIINASWNGLDRSQILADAVAAARTAGIHIVTAAGNENRDNDLVPLYPGSFGLDNIVVVTASSKTNGVWKSSTSLGANTGVSSVDLAAPGDDIWSTGIFTDQSYARKSGTSFSTAFVSGAAVLIRARFPQYTAAEIRNRLLTTTDPLAAFAGKTRTGGRLNLEKALKIAPLAPLRLSVSSGQNPKLTYQSYSVSTPIVLEKSTNLKDWAPIQTNSLATPAPWQQTASISGSTTVFYRLRYR